MYTTKNFRSKKELKAAVEAYNTISTVDGQRTGRAVTYFQPGPFGGNEKRDGIIACEGPHYPEAHKWYAECTVCDGIIVKVK